MATTYVTLHMTYNFGSRSTSLPSNHVRSEKLNNKISSFALFPTYSYLPTI